MRGVTYGPTASGAGGVTLIPMSRPLGLTGRSLCAARRRVSWLILVVGGFVVVTSLIRGFTADPQQGEGWIGGPIEAVFAGGPLLAVGFGLRSTRQVVARRTAVAALALALVVGFVLVMQLLDPNETAADRMLNALALVMYLAASFVEVPAFTGHWGPGATSARL